MCFNMFGMDRSGFERSIHLLLLFPFLLFCDRKQTWQGSRIKLSTRMPDRVSQNSHKVGHRVDTCLPPVHVPNVVKQRSDSEGVTEVRVKDEEK